MAADVEEREELYEALADDKTENTMSDDTNTPDGWNEEAIDMLGEKAEANRPESVDPDAYSKQDAGWMAMYIECPDCESPMSRTTTESNDINHPGPVHSATESTHRFVCPECGSVASRIRVERVTAKTDDIKRAYNRLIELGESLFDAFDDR